MKILKKHASKILINTCKLLFCVWPKKTFNNIKKIKIKKKIKIFINHRTTNSALLHTTIYAMSMKNI